MDIIGFMTNNSIISLIIVGFLVTFISSFVLKMFTDQEKIKDLKKRQKELNAKVRELQKKGDFSKIEELNSEVMEVSMNLMKASFSGKQFMVTTIPFLLLFSWLRGLYVPVLGNSWFWIYFASTMLSSFIVRKILKMA
jgi:uncharacterized membrane protein (DUF106 family)